MPNSARHDPRLDAGYDAFGHHEHRSNAQCERPRLHDVRDEGSVRAPWPPPGAGHEDKDSPSRRTRPGSGSRTYEGSQTGHGALYWTHECDADL